MAAADDETPDALRRTRLANERIAPGLAGGTEWPYRAVGASFGVLGIAIACFALLRQRQVERALDDGGYTPLDAWIAFALVAATVGVGPATIALVVAGSCSSGSSPRGRS